MVSSRWSSSGLSQRTGKDGVETERADALESSREERQLSHFPAPRSQPNDFFLDLSLPIYKMTGITDTTYARCLTRDMLPKIMLIALYHSLQKIFMAYIVHPPFLSNQWKHKRMN